MHAKTQLDGWIEQMELDEATIAAKGEERVSEIICDHCAASGPEKVVLGELTTRRAADGYTTAPDV